MLAQEGKEKSIESMRDIDALHRAASFVLEAFYTFRMNAFDKQITKVERTDYRKVDVKGIHLPYPVPFPKDSGLRDGKIKE